ERNEPDARMGVDQLLQDVPDRSVRPGLDAARDIEHEYSSHSARDEAPACRCPTAPGLGRGDHEPDQQRTEDDAQEEGPAYGRAELRGRRDRNRSAFDLPKQSAHWTVVG